MRAVEAVVLGGPNDQTVLVRVPATDYEALLPQLALVRRRLEALVGLRTGVRGLRVVIEPGSVLARRYSVLRLPSGHADATPTRCDLGGDGGVDERTSIAARGLRIQGRPDAIVVGIGGLLLGRAARWPGQIIDPQVSVRHCHVEPVPEGLLFTDLASTNGTWIDGRRIAAPTVLTFGGVARIGSIALRAEVLS
jgi:hypothetical protein